MAQVGVGVEVEGVFVSGVLTIQERKRELTPTMNNFRKVFTRAPVLRFEGMPRRGPCQQPATLSVP